MAGHYDDDFHPPWDPAEYSESFAPGKFNNYPLLRKYFTARNLLIAAAVISFAVLTGLTFGGMLAVSAIPVVGIVYKSIAGPGIWSVGFGSMGMLAVNKLALASAAAMATGAAILGAGAAALSWIKNKFYPDLYIEPMRIDYPILSYTIPSYTITIPSLVLSSANPGMTCLSSADNQIGAVNSVTNCNLNAATTETLIQHSSGRYSPLQRPDGQRFSILDPNQADADTNSLNNSDNRDGLGFQIKPY